GGGRGARGCAARGGRAAEGRADAPQGQLHAGDRRRGQARPGRRYLMPAECRARGGLMTEAAILDHDIREQAAQHTLAANPLVGVRGKDILDSARVLLGRIVSSPGAATRVYLSFLGDLGRIATGGSTLAPDAGDRRFADPAWAESAAYRALAQCWLAWGDALLRFIDEAGMD